MSAPKTSDLVSAQSSVPLRYSVHSCSSFSGSYEPSNILLDRPHDMSSRWSGASVAAVASGQNASTSSSAAAVASSSNVAADSVSSPARASPAPVVANTSGKHYLILHLEKPSIARSITFGKYHKAHPCNLKDFKVYGGPSPDPSSGLWVRLLRAGLRNDAIAEDFSLKHVDGAGVPFTVRYLKIVPLASHSPNYNISIWHVALKGIDEASIASRVSEEYDEHCESITTRLILKHLRARGHHSAFEALLRTSKLDGASSMSWDAAKATGSWEKPSQRPFEHPLVTQLFQSIMRGDWDAAESCLERSARTCEGSEEDSLLGRYVADCAQNAQWTRLLGTDRDGDIPCARGGHQLAVDSGRGTAYLFGGWDGKRDLNDLWIYYIGESRWRCISRDTSLQGGPSPRSCHKIAFDSRSGIIYVLGRYVDYDRARSRSRDTSQRPSSAPTGTRETSSGDQRAGDGNAVSSSPNAPSTDTAARLSASPSPVQTTTQTYLSDFYRFSTRTEKWDRLSADTTRDGGPKLIFDHQMVVDEEFQNLYVFGGRVAHWDPARLELSGMWKYDCIQRTWTFLFDDDTRTGGKIPSRVGHSMLLDLGPKGSKNARSLWILAGQRGESYLADMYTYDIATGTVRSVAQDYSQSSGGPEGGFTQRATIDSAKRHIYLFNGLVRRSKASDEKVRSAFWMYNMDKNEWTILWQGGQLATESARNLHAPADAGRALSEGINNAAGAQREPTHLSGNKEPRPRYAAQMVYDEREQLFLLFGGNPADELASQCRLDDLWMLKLLQPTVGETLRRAKFVLRQQRFKEMAASVPRARSSAGSVFVAEQSVASSSLNAMEALMYLQTEVAEVVNHDAPEESQTFRRLVAGLLSPEDLTPRAAHSPASPHSSDGSTPSMAVESDGLPPIDEDSDMLSISQVLGNAGSADLSKQPALGLAQRPSSLLRQRLEVYRQLLELYPTYCTEPVAELSGAIAAFLARSVTHK